jgi:uncharacterized coiled-coil protein SlyX
MDIEQRLNDLEEIIKNQQRQISELTSRLKHVDGELGVIDAQMNRSGENGYPSLYNVKEKLVGR